ncbi:Panacea domain-containing protein [Nostoc sp. C117]|uniref:Panacea domain-containing protein n=1 Tax=Nostoc sp. C117 TaxID=3349875 RepID=UPI00370D1B26
MLNAVNIAQYFLEKGEGSVTQLKLQKLVYYAQGFYLAKIGNPLFPEVIYAWDMGPVLVELRREYGAYGNRPIPTASILPLDFSIEKNTVRYLDNIWICFGRYTAIQLVKMTHREQPWIEAYQGKRSSAIISQETMKNYFSMRLNELEEVAASNSIFCEDSDILDLSDLEEVINCIENTEKSFDSQYSPEFIEFSKDIAEKVKAQMNQEASEDYLSKLAKYLASHTD